MFAWTFLWKILVGSAGLLVLPVPVPTNPLVSHCERLLVVGMGRVGVDCAHWAKPCFSHVTGTIRQGSDVPADSIHRVPWLNQVDLFFEISQASHVLWTIPWTTKTTQDPYLQTVWHNVCESTKSSQHRWLGLISTSGVYGNHNGTWVDEESPLLCELNTTASLYREREVEVLAAQGHVFRCAGIYDAYRSALHTVFAKGRPVLTAKGTTEGLVNRVHSHDLARAVLASMIVHKPPYSTGQVYNIADNKPAMRSQVMKFAAHLLEAQGVARPEASSDPGGKISQRALRRQTDNKRISNRRMKQLLKEASFLSPLLSPSASSDLLYPTYHEGLKAILLDPSTPWMGGKPNKY